MFNPNTYFKQLAERHQDILHDGDITPRFFQEHSTSTVILHQNLLLQRLKRVDGNVLISQFNGSEDVLGNSINNANAVVSGHLYFLRKVNHNDFDQIEAAHITLKEIWMDFRTQIKTDMRADIIPPFLLAKTRQLNLGIIIADFVGLMVSLSYVEARCYTDRSKFNPAP